MKGKLTAIALAFSSLMVAGHSLAADGTVHFTGEIIDSTCQVTPDTKDQTVTLGTINKTALPNTGDTAAPTAFNISLENCPETYTQAAVRFDGNEDTNSKGNLAVNAGGATGVAITLSTADGTPVNLYEDSPYSTITGTAGMSDGTVTMKFIARYIATSLAGGVTPGAANADSQFTIEYKK